MMKTLLRASVLALAVVGAVSPALAQGYGGYGYQDRGYDYEQRGSRYRDRDYDSDRGGYGRDYGGDRRGGYGGGFDAAEYLRCNPDVRRAIQRGQMSSAADHYRVFGRREGRRLSC